jgi:hypothetical protein
MTRLGVKAYNGTKRAAASLPQHILASKMKQQLRPSRIDQETKCCTAAGPLLRLAVAQLYSACCKQNTDAPDTFRYNSRHSKGCSSSRNGTCP